MGVSGSGGEALDADPVADETVAASYSCEQVANGGFLVEEYSGSKADWPSDDWEDRDIEEHLVEQVI